MRTSVKKSFKEWQVLPPPSRTPTLSCWEREHLSPARQVTERGICRTSLGREEEVLPPFPVPQEDQQGEGKIYTDPSANYLNDHD